MAQYTTILANEFNTVQSTVANVLGTGSGSRGYGSTVNSSPVSVGANITKAQFDSLKTDLDICYGHISGGSSGATSVVVGNDITWANIVTYQVAATYVDTNRDSSGVGTTIVSVASLPAGWGNASGNRIATLTGSFTWSSADAMRYFFNQNSRVSMYGEAITPPGGLGSKSVSWGDVANGLNVALTAAEHRGPYSIFQTVSSGQLPYSSGTGLFGRLDIFAPSSNTINFQIQCTDGGGDDGDADGVTVASNIDCETKFYIRAVGLSQDTGITRYDPTISFGSWSYAA